MSGPAAAATDVLSANARKLQDEEIEVRSAYLSIVALLTHSL